MRSFLPPQATDLFPSLNPDKDHLEACRDNLFFREYLNRAHSALFNHRERLSSEKSVESFDERKGRIAGFEEAFKILESLRIEVENPPEPED